MNEEGHLAELKSREWKWLGLGERPSITRSSELNGAPPSAVLCRCCLTAHPPSFIDHLLWLSSLQGGTGVTFLVSAVLRLLDYLLVPFIHSYEIDRIWLASCGWAFHRWSRLLWPRESGSQSKQGSGLGTKSLSPQVCTTGTGEEGAREEADWPALVEFLPHVLLCSRCSGEFKERKQDPLRA